MPHRLQTFLLPFFLLIALCMAGCSSHTYVRHLASDASLVIPNQSTQKEIKGFMGFPDQTKKMADGTEQWVYFQTNKSTLRKTPYFGDKLGHENYDVVLITFSGETVSQCTYRLLTEKEFQESGIQSDGQLNAR